MIEGRKASIQLPGLLPLQMTSDTAFLPALKKVKLYGLFVNSVKTAKNQVQVFEASTEDRILSRLKGGEMSDEAVLGQ